VEARLTDQLNQAIARLSQVLLGKEPQIRLALTCLLARGHLLLEDLPGMGKTTLAEALARCFGLDFARVHFTSDLLPADLTGINVLDQATGQFRFQAGPLMTQVLLADEINRASPRTQSALLEAMAERQVTVDGVRQALSHEFFVIATQNPTEQHGTYPLPEAQLDRFAMKLSIGYPAREDELDMLADALTLDDCQSVPSEPVFTPLELQRLQHIVARQAVALGVRDYLVRLAEATRRHPRVTLGLSPRGLLILQRASQARALLHARRFVTPDDVQEVARPVLAVRLSCDVEQPARLIDEILANTPAPPLAPSGKT